MGGLIRCGWISRSWGAPIFKPEVPKCFQKSYFACSPENLWICFFRVCLGILHWKRAGIFGEFFWSPFPGKRSTKNPGKIRRKFGEKFGAKSGTKIRKTRGTFVLQLFWPKKEVVWDLWTENRGAPKTRNSTTTNLTPHSRPSEKISCRCSHTQIQCLLRQVVVFHASWENHKNPRVRKNLSALGPEMGASILWTPGKMRSFSRKTHAHKIPRFFWGGVFWVWGGGGGVKCRFYFYGREDFSEKTQLWAKCPSNVRTSRKVVQDFYQTYLVVPCGWDFNRGRGCGWESRPLSRFRFALRFKGFWDTIAPLSRGGAP